MEQEKTNNNQVSTKDTKTPTPLGPGQALLAYGSRECDQFFCEEENRRIVRRPIALTKFFTDLDRQVYAVACGGLHTVLLTTNGEVYTFGCNDEGALGRTGDETEPGKVDLEHPMDMISAGDSHSIACDSAHSIVFHWGVYRNTNKGNISKSETPHRIGEDEFKRKKIKKILSGANHTLALVDGKVYAWGDAEVGILGRMPTSRRKLDQGLKIEGMGVKGVVEDIYTGAYHAFLKKTDKKKQESYSAIYAWGLNNNGQLGLGHAENTHIPGEVIELRGKNIKSITGGEHHTVALTEEGEVYCFGKNDDGQVGLGKDFEEKEESEEEEEKPAENKKTPAKPAKPPAKSTSKKGKGKGKKGGSQKKGDAAEEDKGEEKEDAEKKDEETNKDEAKEEKAETKTETAATEPTEKKAEEKEAEAPAAAEPEKAEATGKSAEKEKEAEAEQQTKKSVFQFVKKPHKVELAGVEKIFSGSDFNYAITKDNDVYSWGMGENYVLGTKNEEAVYVPTKLDANLFEGKKIATLGLGAQHVIVLGVDKGDKDPEIDEEAIAKLEEAGKSSKKGTTAKKGEKKGRGTAKKGEDEDEKDVKKDLSKTLEEEHEDKDEKKGQKKSLKRKATGEKEEEEGVKKVKKSPSKEKEAGKKSEEKMEEEKPEQAEQGKADQETIVEEKKEESAKPAEDEKKEESGKMEVEQTENKEAEDKETEKKEEKAAEPAQASEETKKTENEEPAKEAEKTENKEAQGEAAATENKPEEKTA